MLSHSLLQSKTVSSSPQTSKTSQVSKKVFDVINTDFWLLEPQEQMDYFYSFLSKWKWELLRKLLLDIRESYKKKLNAEAAAQGKILDYVWYSQLTCQEIMDWEDLYLTEIESRYQVLLESKDHEKLVVLTESIQTTSELLQSPSLPVWQESVWTTLWRERAFEAQSAYFQSLFALNPEKARIFALRRAESSLAKNRLLYDRSSFKLKKIAWVRSLDSFDVLSHESRVWQERINQTQETFFARHIGLQEYAQALQCAQQNTTHYQILKTHFEKIAPVRESFETLAPQLAQKIFGPKLFSFDEILFSWKRKRESAREFLFHKLQSRDEKKAIRDLCSDVYWEQIQTISKFYPPKLSLEKDKYCAALLDVWEHPDAQSVYPIDDTFRKWARRSQENNAKS